jgi:hypothetical protein
MSVPSYEEALAEARRVGAANVGDAGQIAGLCASVLQTVCGAVSPKLVYEGAMKKRLSGQEFGRLMGTDPRSIEELQWL